MYPKNDLSAVYERDYYNRDFSSRLPDITKRYTLYIINKAINCCEHWDSFLDVGAGSGHYSSPLLGRFKRGVACEVENNQDLERLKKNHSSFSVVNDYIQKINFSQKYDFILLADLFEHLPLNDVSAFLDKISAIQGRGGVVYLLTPNVFFCGPADQSDIYHTKHKNGHHKHYTKEEIAALLAARGYELLLFSYEEHKARRRLERVYRALSRRDKKFFSNSAAKTLSCPLVFVVGLILKVWGYFVWRDENIKSHIEDEAMSLALVFKKIK